MTIAKSLPVSEQFLSLQGEGKTAGIPAYFLRLKSCNLLCGGKGTDKDKKLHDGATWRCDTIEVWLKGKQKEFDAIIKDFGDDFIKNLAAKTHHLVITGGEPVLHDTKISYFIGHLAHLCNGDFNLEVETNGTLPGKWISGVNYWNVSPKLSNSGIPYNKRIKPDVLRDFARDDNSIFKFVISRRSDFEEVLQIIRDPAINIPPEKVWLMPAADNRKKLLEVSDLVATICANYGYKMSNRLHIQIWDKKTGV